VFLEDESPDRVAKGWKKKGVAGGGSPMVGPPMVARKGEPPRGVPL
jgi:hypothetical protein